MPTETREFFGSLRDLKKQVRSSSPIHTLFCCSHDTPWLRTAVLEVLEKLNLPDLTSRKGLKRLHDDFPKIHQKLNAALEQSSNSGDAKMTCGILGIYAKIFTIDDILQDKLIEKGCLKQLTELLDDDSICPTALQALSTLAHHASKKCTSEIHQYIPTFAALLRKHMDDPDESSHDVIGLTVNILKNILEVLPIPDLQGSADVKGLAPIILDCLRQKAATEYTVDHGMPLLGYLADWGIVSASESVALISFHIACLRRVDIYSRIAALDSIRIMMPDEVWDEEEHLPAFSIFEPLRNPASARKLPPKLTAVMKQHGLHLCESYVSNVARTNYEAALVLYSINRDFVKLGRALANNMLSAEFALPEYLCMCCALPKYCCLGNWEYLLHDSAVALWATGDPLDNDLADMLEWKYLRLNSRDDEAEHLIDKAIARNPDFAYFYLVKAMRPGRRDPVESMRTAKRGLRCSTLSDAGPWLRYMLMHMSAFSAATLAMVNLRDMEDKGPERYTLFKSAYEDMKVLVKQRPPDSVHVYEEVMMYVFLKFVIEGHQVSVDAKEFDGLKKQLELWHDFMDFLDQPLRQRSRTSFQAERTLVLFNYSAARWDTVITRVDEMEFILPHSEKMNAVPPKPSSLQLLSKPKRIPEPELHLEEKSFNDWLESFDPYTLKVCTDPLHDPTKYATHKFSADMVELFECSNCRRTSAVLRKCGRCGEAWYCDEQCQRTHWKEGHKQLCQKR